MGKRKSSGGGGGLILLALAAVVYLQPAVIAIKSLGLARPKQDPFDLALNSPLAWLGSTAFWVLLYVVIKKLTNNDTPKLSPDTQKTESEEYIKGIVAGEFPTTTLLLGAGEKAYFVEQGVRLYETRASRRGTGVGTKVGGIFLGSSESHAVDKLVEVDSGQLVITNEKISFDGRTEQRTIALKDIQNIESHADFFSVASSKRNKKCLFQVRNPLLCQVVVRNIANGNFDKAAREGLEP